MRSGMTRGSTFPDYELPDHENIPRRLSELQGDDPVTLTLACSSHYCPKEHQQHLELAANSEWKARGAEFLTPPIQHETEIRCYARDPDGHLIEVGQTTRRPA